MEWIVRFLFGILVELLVHAMGRLVRATGALLIRALTLGRIRTGSAFSGHADRTPLIGTRTWDGTLVAGPWTAFLIGLLFWIILATVVIALAKP
jgi:hypothetical protein